MPTPEHVRRTMDHACYRATTALGVSHITGYLAIPGNVPTAAVHTIQRGLRTDGARILMCPACQRATIAGYGPADTSTETQVAAWHDEQLLPDRGLRAVILRSGHTTGLVSHRYERVVIVGHNIPQLHQAGPEAPPVEIGRDEHTVFVWPTDRPENSHWGHHGAYVRPAGSGADWPGVFGHRHPVALYDTTSPATV